MEKFAQYREHILHEEQFLNNLDEQVQVIEQYTQKINEISPNILNNDLNFNDDVKTTNLVSSQKFDIKKFDQLKEYTNTFNKDKCDQLVDQTANFISETENSQLIDSQGRMSESWLKSLPAYDLLMDIDSNVHDSEQALIDFQTKSQVLTEQLAASVKSSQQDHSTILNENLVTRYTPPKKMHNLKKFYVITLWCLLVLILVMLGLIIAGVLTTW